FLLDQFCYGFDQTRLLVHRRFATTTGATNSILRWRFLLRRQLLQPTSYRAARYAGNGWNGNYSPPPCRKRFTGRKKPQAFLIKSRAHGIIANTDGSSVYHQPYY